MGQKCGFPKSDPRPCGMLKQVFFKQVPIFEPVVTRFGPWNIPKCLEKGLFWIKNGSKMGQNRIFPKVILDHWGCSNKRNKPILAPFGLTLAPSTSCRNLVPFARTLEPYCGAT